MRKVQVLAVMFVFMFLVGLAGVADARVIHAKVKPFIVDLTESGIVSAAWVTHQGLPDAGKSNHALFLAKSGETAIDAKAGAVVFGATGLTFDATTPFAVGFDIRVDGWSSLKSPRFEVTLAADPATIYYFGSATGIVTPVNARWNRVSFTAAQATDADGTPVVMPTTGAINSIIIVFDEGTDATGGTGAPGFAYLDNIKILNFPPIGKPGNVNLRVP